MCLLAIHFQTIPGAPVAVAANREEFFDRPALPPEIQSGSPRVLCGTDRRAGGTWLGVNQFGVLVAVTNRAKRNTPENPRSRGLLCRELLDCRTAAEAGRQAAAELKTGNYAGVNLLCLDAGAGQVIHGGEELVVVELSPGLHVITGGDLNDPADPRITLARGLFEAHTPSSAVDFIHTAATIVAHRSDTPTTASIILRYPDRGTVSSTLLALTPDPSHAQYHHAPSPPDRCAFEDYSELLRDVLQK